MGVKGVRIAVVVDNNVHGEGFETAWGLSIHVNINSVEILFDAGPDPTVLKRNAKRLGIDLSKLVFAVVSHGHGDHCNGLRLLAELRPGLKVLTPPDPSLVSYVLSLGLKPVAINRTAEAVKSVYVVKPLYGPPIEQALAIKTDKGLVIIVGCSHPGIVNIVKQAVKDVGSKPYMVVGGLHMVGASASEIEEVARELIELGVEKIYPLHCSGDEVKHYLEVYYPNKYGSGGVGLEIVISEPSHT
jgi:7,8-dihydropterin-6-yl-methyl-4-(beta-D-ribofuranosyl)aminobenzene 5'-phosphate synthase